MALRFSGFSTKNKKAINHVLTGKDLVIEDLMNHLMTRKGERIMMPTFGSIIHDLIFEPLTSDVKMLIEEDIKEIVAEDPRCEFINLVVKETEHTVSAYLTVSILPENTPVTLEIDLERE
jgi:phage baseplate assembly protein W